MSRLSRCFQGWTLFKGQKRKENVPLTWLTIHCPQIYFKGAYQHTPNQFMVHNLLEKDRLKNVIISLLSIRKSNPKITFGWEVISSEVQHHLKMAAHSCRYIQRAFEISSPPVPCANLETNAVTSRWNHRGSSQLPGLNRSGIRWIHLHSKCIYITYPVSLK